MELFTFDCRIYWNNYFEPFVGIFQLLFIGNIETIMKVAHTNNCWTISQSFYIIVQGQYWRQLCNEIILFKVNSNGSETTTLISFFRLWTNLAILFRVFIVNFEQLFAYSDNNEERKSTWCSLMMLWNSKFVWWMIWRLSKCLHMRKWQVIFLNPFTWFIYYGDNFFNVAAKE